MLQALPKIEQKNNNQNYEITLYGNENVVSKTIYDKFLKELVCGLIDIVSLSNDRTIMMVRDRGHALSIKK